MINQTILGTDVSKRIYGLDILRTAAILQVLFAHTLNYLPEAILPYVSLYDGVTIFFTLSGFLIGNILISEIEGNGLSLKTLKHFWVNRWMRTLPLYYFILTLFVLIPSLALGDNHVAFSENDSFKYFVFLQNFAWSIPDSFIESWSLAVEEWFYLLTPIVLVLISFLFKLKIKKTFLLTIIIFIIGGLVIRLLYSYALDLNNITSSEFNLIFRTRVITRLDSIIYGVLGAYCAFYYPAFWKQVKYKALFLSVLVYLFFIVILPTMLSSFFLYQYLNKTVLHFSLWGIISLLLLPFFHSLKTSEGFIFKTVVFISLISYSIYLVHNQVIYFIVRPLEKYWDSNFLSFILICVLTVVFSVFTYKFIEVPFMVLRKRINK